MTKISLFTICWLIAINSYSQKHSSYDSTLMTFVKGISSEIHKRAFQNRTVVSPASVPKFVLIGKEPVAIDSLYKHNIRDFKSITVNFDYPTAIYGSQAELGIISLQRKDSTSSRK